MTFIYTGLAYGQTNMIDYYKQAMPLILNSNEFKGYGVNHNNYHVSPEIISFSNYSELFTDELSNDKSFEIDKNEVSRLEKMVDKMNNMSFSRFICPENKEGILNEMERSFKSTRSARVSKCE